MRGTCILALFLGCCAGALAQIGNSGSIQGTVTDPSGLPIAGAKVTIVNRVSGYQKEAVTDDTGAFHVLNVPFNSYHIDIAASGFQPAQQDVPVRSTVPVNLKISLNLGTQTTSVTVEESADLIERVPEAHVDIDQSLISKLPMTSTGTGLSDLITLSAPGVVADSNGFFHPLGDHAQTSFMVDNQPISDQQSKQFSTQLPLDAIQSVEVTTGAPQAEYGDKTSLIVNTTTKSGLGQKLFGSLAAKAGSFGTYGEDATLGGGNGKFGDFLAINSSRTGRFLDTPEFLPFHDRGNNLTAFDRFDYQPGQNDMLHLNLGFARNWFQIPNTYDQQDAGQDQRQRVLSYNIAPGFVHLFGPSLDLTVNPYFRQDQVSYYPSRDVFDDDPVTLGQSRRLSNLGLRADLSYAKGIHNAKAGLQVSHTFLTESFQLGLTDPAFNAPCVDASGQPIGDPTQTSPNQCGGAGAAPNPAFAPGLLPFDLSRGGSLFLFHGHTDIKEYGFYLQDQIKFGNFTVNAGIRGDIYKGLVSDGAAEPRLGLSYLIKPTNTVLRASYSHTLETPYNENLILSSATGSGGLGTNIFGAQATRPLEPGRREQYNAGLQQAIGKFFVIDADYFWKFTDNAFDFDTLLNTPVTFPISWRKSKIDGVAGRISMPNYHGLSAFTVFGHTRARFFGPEDGGLIFNSPVSTAVFRIDHDQAFQQTTDVRYQYKKNGPWVSFTWRYDSGEVAGAVPDEAAALALTADQQQQIGLFCGSSFATLASPITSCPIAQFGTTRLRIPAPGTENDDTNPPRIAPRNLFDAGAGFDNLFPHGDKAHFTLSFTVTNLTNEVALYNFLSTFSGTHFVAPRTYQIALGYAF